MLKSKIIITICVLPIINSVALAQLPDYFDWRDVDGEDWMSPVRNQGQCGSCWAFAAVGIVEAQYNIFFDWPDFDINLSEEHLVSNCASGSCDGGWHDIALNFIRDSGITDEACFPYVDLDCLYYWCSHGFPCTYGCSNAECSEEYRCAEWEDRLWQIDSTVNIDDNAEAIKNYIYTVGPVAALVAMTGEFEEDGIYRCANGFADHVVVLVGWNETDEYWIVKNSWGTVWPDEQGGGGYFKVGFGECGIGAAPYGAGLHEPNSHWKLDETTGTKAEDSIGNNNGKLTYMDPETDWVTGKIGGALDFDGIDDYVSLSPIGALLTDTVTIAAWIKTNDLSEGLHPIVTQYDYPADGYYFYVSTDELGTDEPMFYLAGVTVQSGVSINEGQWYHLAGTNDGSNLKIYVNGELKGTPQSSSGRTGAYLYPYIGYDDYDVGSYFRGIIDDVRVYNYALDLFEIWDAMSGDAPRFRVKNSSGETVAWFDSFGNLFLKGTLEQGDGEEPQREYNDGFKFKNSSDTNLAIIDSTNGNMYIYGKKKNWNTPSAGKDEFIIENSSGAVAYISEVGNLYLQGKLYENPEQ